MDLSQWWRFSTLLAAQLIVVKRRAIDPRLCGDLPARFSVYNVLTT